MVNKLKRYDRVFWIEVDKIKPNPMQPRHEFGVEGLESLTDSIRQYGVLQPLVVTRKETETSTGTNVEYELISGERRLRASKLAGLSQVPVVIRDDGEDKLKLELAIIENLQREDLNPIDRALAFKKLVDMFNLRHHEVGKKVGKSREYVSNTIRLLNLPEAVQQSLISGQITEGHCRPILMVSDHEEAQANFFKDVVNKKMTVREAERASREIAVERARKPSIDSGAGLELMQWEKRLSSILGGIVKIEQKDGKDRVFIDFENDNDFKLFLNKIRVVEASRGRAGKEENTKEDVVAKVIDKIKSTNNVVVDKKIEYKRADNIIETNIVEEKDNRTEDILRKNKIPATLPFEPDVVDVNTKENDALLFPFKADIVNNSEPNKELVVSKEALPMLVKNNSLMTKSNIPTSMLFHKNEIKKDDGELVKIKKEESAPVKTENNQEDRKVIDLSFIANAPEIEKILPEVPIAPKEKTISEIIEDKRFANGKNENGEEDKTSLDKKESLSRIESFIENLENKKTTEPPVNIVLEERDVPLPPVGAKEPPVFKFENDINQKDEVLTPDNKEEKEKKEFWQHFL